MPTIEAERDLLSIGKLCELYQCTPNRVERACDATGVRPALRLNGQPWFSDSDAQRLREALTAGHP